MTLLVAGLLDGAVVGGGTLLFAVVAVGAVALAFRGRSRVSAGGLVMTHGLGYRGLGLVMLAMGVSLLGVAVAGVAGALELGDVVWIPFVFGGLFSLGGAFMTIEGSCRRVVVTDDGIGGRGWRGSTGPIPWDEVSEVRFSGALSAFVVEGDRRAVVVPTVLGGRQAFMKACREHLAKKVYGRVFKEHGKRWI